MELPSAFTKQKQHAIWSAWCHVLSTPSLWPIYRPHNQYWHCRNRQVYWYYHMTNSWFSLWEKNEHIIAHFEYSFTCHYSKTVWLAENINEIKVTHYEKTYSHIRQKFSDFEKGLGKKFFFCLTEITIIFTDVHRINTKPKNNYQNI